MARISARLIDRPAKKATANPRLPVHPASALSRDAQHRPAPRPLIADADGRRSRDRRSPISGAPSGPAPSASCNRVAIVSLLFGGACDFLTRATGVVPPPAALTRSVGRNVRSHLNYITYLRAHNEAGKKQICTSPAALCRHCLQMPSSPTCADCITFERRSDN